MVALTSRARSPRPLLTLFAAVAFLLAIWSVLWLFLENRANAGLDAWMTAEAARGRQWTCPGRQVGGYPIALSLHCDRPTFRGEVAGRLAEGSVEAIDAEIRLDRPRRLAIVPRGPLNLRSEAEDFDLAVSWTDLTVFVDDIQSRVPRGGFDAGRLAVTLETAGRGDLNLRAARARGESGRTAPASDDAAFRLAATDVVFPTLDSLPGFEAPADVDARGVLRRADLLQPSTRAALDTWRGAGGKLDLATLTVAKGSFQGEASGLLTLDDAHRPAGKLEASLSGFEPIAQRYGIPLAGVRLGGLLGSILGGGKPPPDAPAGSVQLPLVLEGGALSVGPFRTGVRLDPVY